MTEKLSSKTIRELGGPDAGAPYVIHWDSNVPGLGLRVTRAGARSFVLNYRARGIQRRMTIGSLRAGATAIEVRQTLDAVRRKASQLKSKVQHDQADPMNDRRADRAALTMKDLAARYEEKHLPKKRPSSQSSDKMMIERLILPALRNRRVSDVQFEDVDNLHRKVTLAGSPVRANRVVALLSKMFSLAIAWHMRSDNPARGIQRNQEERRQRYLSPDELRRLSLALAKGRQSANAVRLLLLTGARRGEVLGATWDQFDLDNGVWTKPSAHTKQKKEHRVPLSAPAHLLLSEMREGAEEAAEKKGCAPSQFVFPSSADGKAQSDLKRFWAAACKVAGISGVRIHDLRHTYASALASSGQSLPIIGQLLGHTNPNTTARYAHLLDDPLRAATEKAASVLAGVPKRKGGKVIDLAQRARARRK
jgi:integrase